MQAVSSNGPAVTGPVDEAVERALLESPVMWNLDLRGWLAGWLVWESERESGRNGGGLALWVEGLEDSLVWRSLGRSQGENKRTRENINVLLFLRRLHRRQIHHNIRLGAAQYNHLIATGVDTRSAQRLLKKYILGCCKCALVKCVYYTENDYILLISL